MLHLWTCLLLHTTCADTRVHEAGHKTTVKVPAAKTAMRRRSVAVDIQRRFQLCVALRLRQQQIARIDHEDPYAHLYGWPPVGVSALGYTPPHRPGMFTGVYGNRIRAPEEICAEGGSDARVRWRGSRVGKIGPGEYDESPTLRAFVAPGDVDALHSFHKTHFAGRSLCVTERCRAFDTGQPLWASATVPGPAPQPCWYDHGVLADGTLFQTRALFTVDAAAWALVHLYVPFRECDDVSALPLLARRTIKKAPVPRKGLVPEYHIVQRKSMKTHAFVVSDVARVQDKGVWQVAPRQVWQAFDYRDQSTHRAWKNTLR